MHTGRSSEDEAAPCRDRLGAATPTGLPCGWLPEQRALIFADALTAPRGELRVWSTPWHQERTLPALRALLALPFERVIVSHGEPVPTRSDYERALELDPWRGWHADMKLIGKEPQVHYLLFYDAIEDYQTKRSAFRAAHLQHAWNAHQRGELVLAGALADPVDGAVLLFRGSSPEVAEAFARSDPYVKNGLITRWWVREWTTVVGDDAALPISIEAASLSRQGQAS